MKKNVFLVSLLGGLVVITSLFYYNGMLWSSQIERASGKEAAVVPEQIGNKNNSTDPDGNSFIDTVLQKLSIQEKEPENPPVIPRETKPIRGIYVSAAGLNSPKVREKILDILNTTRVNALVIDVKDSSGHVFLPIVEDQYKFTESPFNQSALDFIKTMKEKNVYLIARIVVFQDPLVVKQFPQYALKNKDGSIWRDRKGMAFLDPQNKNVWEHVKHLSLATRDFGFDEMNYDYIRYPSDGKISDIAYHIPEGSTKSDMIEKFFMYLHDEIKIKEGIYISADIFGDTVRLKGDPGIGQVFEKTVPHFDAVAPMVYPSHFSPGSYGMKNPDAAPKEIMQGIARDTNTRYDAWCDTVFPVVPIIEQDSTKLEKAKQAQEEKRNTDCPVWRNRPWIQDFSLHADYGVKEVKDQINALESAGITSWLVWNPSTRYTKDAFK